MWLTQRRVTNKALNLVSSALKMLLPGDKGFYFHIISPTTSL